MLITVVIMGKYMECQAKGKTSEAIQALMRLAPESAVVVELDGDNRVVAEQTISSRLVHHGDLLKV
jgi:Cu+-exporting ATPase